MERRDASPAEDAIDRCPACGHGAPGGAAACPACGEPLALAGDDAPLPPLPDGGLPALMPAWLRAAPDPAPGAPVAPAEATGDRRPISFGAGAEVAPPSPEPSPGPNPAHRWATPSPSPTLAPAPAPAGSSSAGFPPDRDATGAEGPTADAPKVVIPAGGAAPVASVNGADRDPATFLAAEDIPPWLRALAADDGRPFDGADVAAPVASPMGETAQAPVFLPPAPAIVAPRPTAPGSDAGRSATERRSATAADAGPASGAAAGHRAAGIDDRPGEPRPVAGATPPTGPTAPVSPRAAGRGRLETSSAGTPGAVRAAPAPGGDSATSAASGRAAAPSPGIGPSDPARQNAADGPMQEGVAAGLATLLILFLAAVVAFLVWRATAGW